MNPIGPPSESSSQSRRLVRRSIGADAATAPSVCGAASGASEVGVAASAAIENLPGHACRYICISLYVQMRMKPDPRNGPARLEISAKIVRALVRLPTVRSAGKPISVARAEPALALPKIASLKRTIRQAPGKAVSAPKRCASSSLGSCRRPFSPARSVKRSALEDSSRDRAHRRAQIDPCRALLLPRSREIRIGPLPPRKASTLPAASSAGLRSPSSCGSSTRNCRPRIARFNETAFFSSAATSISRNPPGSWAAIFPAISSGSSLLRTARGRDTPPSLAVPTGHAGPKPTFGFGLGKPLGVHGESSDRRGGKVLKIAVIVSRWLKPDGVRLFRVANSQRACARPAAVFARAAAALRTAPA